MHLGGVDQQPPIRRLEEAAPAIGREAGDPLGGGIEVGVVYRAQLAPVRDADDRDPFDVLAVHAAPHARGEASGRPAPRPPTAPLNGEPRRMPAAGATAVQHVLDRHRRDPAEDRLRQRVAHDAAQAATLARALAPLAAPKEAEQAARLLLVDLRRQLGEVVRVRALAGDDPLVAVLLARLLQELLALLRRELGERLLGGLL